MNQMSLSQYAVSIIQILTGHEGNSSNYFLRGIKGGAKNILFHEAIGRGK